MESPVTGKPKEKILGWEGSQRLEEENPGFFDRIKPERNETQAMLITSGIFLAVFALGCWLVSNPFTTSGISTLKINWLVVTLAIVFEFLDASAGMGYGTAITPLLLILGFDPMQIIPAVMIQQATAGLTGAYLHNEFGNVEWRVRPMSETVRLWVIIAGTGTLAVVFSITSVYAVLKLADKWIKVYVSLLLIVMGFVSLFHARKTRPYRPKRMLFFGALAGFNKGIGGGGYGPVVTIGGILSGVPVKTMMAVTALSEGTVCLVSIVVWLALMKSGLMIDFILLPSMILGSAVAAISAPYAVKVIPSRFWKWFVPAYSCILAVYALSKVIKTL